jgi:capsular exopolysaccharide synthesis family protein
MATQATIRQKLWPVFQTRIEGASPADKLVTALHPRSSHAEAFRVLRTNIQVTDVDRPIRTILVTSPNPTERKSILAANLAVVMTQARLRTVLVDSDMRRHFQHVLFHVTGDHGLTDGLRQPVFSQDGFVQPTPIENLRIVTTGQLLPNPAELLGSKRMWALIDSTGERSAPCISTWS